MSSSEVGFGSRQSLWKSEVRSDFFKPAPSACKEEQVKKNMNWIAAVTMGVALAGYVVRSAPARADNGGEATYKAKCASCHGADGKGETPAGKAMKAGDFASEAVQKASDSDLGDAIVKGKGKMPAFKTLSADQVKDLVAHIRELGKKK
jgi:mono/diheme cytochrome c family protein